MNIVAPPRAVGDTLTPFAIQLTREGVPISLTGLTVKFTMSTLAGVVKVAESACSITNAALGHVEYDFSAGDVDTAGDYVGYFIIYGSGEPETVPPADEGISIEIFDRAEVRTEQVGISDKDFAKLATAPLRTRTVEGTVQERSVDELIKADRYMKTQDQSVPWGIKIARTKPPGTCS